MPLLEKHSDLCREKEEVKKESKNVDEELFKFYAKSEKTKKHLNIKIYLVKYFFYLFNNKLNWSSCCSLLILLKYNSYSI